MFQNNKKIIILVTVILILIALVLFFDSYQNKTATENLSESEKIVKEAAESVNNGTLREVRAIDETDHFLGDINAPVQMIVYNDFECEFCADFQETIEKVKENFGDKVVIAFRHFPLRSNLNAYKAALASECAAEQGKFWEMHDKLFSDNKNNRMNVEQFRVDAKDLELDTGQFDQCLEEEKYKDKIQNQLNEAKVFGISGAPASFVNDQPLPGAYPFEDFTDSASIDRKGIKSVIERYLD